MTEIDYGRLDALEAVLGGRAVIQAAYEAHQTLLGGGGSWGDSAHAQFSSLGSPVGVITPDGKGDLYVDESTPALWQATGSTSADWQVVAGALISSCAFESNDLSGWFLMNGFESNVLPPWATLEGGTIKLDKGDYLMSAVVSLVWGSSEAPTTGTILFQVGAPAHSQGNISAFLDAAAIGRFGADGAARQLLASGVLLGVYEGEPVFSDLETQGLDHPVGINVAGLTISKLDYVPSQTPKSLPPLPASTATFPVVGAPGYFNLVTPAVYAGLFYSDETPSFTLDNYTRELAYEIVNYYGDTVASGALTDSTLTLSDSLPLGWYRLWLTDPAGDDSVFGTSAGDCAFSVSRRNELLPSRPASPSQDPSVADEIRDDPIQGWAVIGPVRYYISDAENLAGAGGEGGTSGSLPGEENDLSYAAGWYLDPAKQDSARPRPSYCEFPNNASPITVGQIAGITSAVASLYAAGIHYFEGPRNEPAVAIAATDMQAFHDAVKAGNAAAQVLGPSGHGLSGADAFFAFGGALGIDIFSFHAYNMIDGDLPFGRYQMSALQAILATRSVDKPMWMTEWGPLGGASGVFNPRTQAQQWTLSTLLLEQYGIPKEHSQYFYGRSHGYWAFPTFYRAGNSVTAIPALARVLSEEVYGKTFTSRITFPDPYDDIYIADLFTDGATGETTLALAACGLPSSSLTFTLAGASTAVLIDPWGASVTLTVTDGQITVPVSELPSYLRLAAGVTATLLMSGLGTDLAVGGVPSTNGTITDLAHLNDGQQHVSPVFEDGMNGAPWVDGSATFPSLPTIAFGEPRTIDTVIVWAGRYFADDSTLLDFDVQTSVDDRTWVTQATITRPAATTRAQVSSAGTFGCTYEEFFDGQWVFPVSFAPVAVKAIRLNIRQTTNGGAYDEASRLADPGLNYGRAEACVRRFAAFHVG